MCGVSPLDYYELTIDELNVIVECYNDKYKHDITLAYYSGVFSQATKPQQLYNDIMSKIAGSSKEMTDEELYRAGLQVFGSLADKKED